jgi:hypothetical protein
VGITHDESIDPVAFALGKLTEALLEQIRLTNTERAYAQTLERNARDAHARLEKLARRIERAFQQGERYDTETGALHAEVRKILDWLEEEGLKLNDGE